MRSLHDSPHAELAIWTAEPGQLPPGLGLIRRDLEDAEVLLRGGGPVPGLGGGAGQTEARLDIAEVLAEWGTCAQT